MNSKNKVRVTFKTNIFPHYTVLYPTKINAAKYAENLKENVIRYILYK
jgi:hypothetical protein